MIRADPLYSIDFKSINHQGTLASAICPQT